MRGNKPAQAGVWIRVLQRAQARGDGLLLLAKSSFKGMAYWLAKSSFKGMAYWLAKSSFKGMAYWLAKSSFKGMAYWLAKSSFKAMAYWLAKSSFKGKYADVTIEEWKDFELHQQLMEDDELRRYEEVAEDLVMYLVKLAKPILSVP